MEGSAAKSVKEARGIGSGGGDPVKLRTTESLKEAAAATDKWKAPKEAVASQLGGPAKEGFTKRKAAAGSSKGKKAATRTAAAAGTSKGEKAATRLAAAAVAEGEEYAADVTPPASEEADTGVQEGGLTRLSQEYVDYILKWKPESIQVPDECHTMVNKYPYKCFSREFIDEETEILRDIAEMMKRNNARFAEFQAWARAEYERNGGYVEVDDLYIAKRLLLRQAMAEEEWDDVEGIECE